MLQVIVFLAVIAALFALVFRGVSLAVWTVATAAAIGVLSVAGVIGSVITWLLVMLVLLPVALLNVTSLRQKFLVTPAFKAFRATLPEMNSTEREALEAGDVWWEAEMFRGRPNWSMLHDFELTQLTDDEQAFIDNETATLCSMLDEWEINFKHKDLPPKVWKYIRNNGFFAMLIPKEFGGLGFSAYAQSTVVGKIASRSITAAVTVMVPNSLGPGELLAHYGTKEQQKHWLPGLADGSELPCFGLTGPEAGSDASAIPDIGVVVEREGELGLSVTFAKRYITLAPVATVVGLAIKVSDPDGLLAKHGHGEAGTVDYGITCVLMPASTEGVEIGRRHFPVGSTFQNGPINGKDVFLPIDSIIGGPAMAGKGWRMLVECLSAGRGISLPALASAAGWGMYTMTSAYTRVRRQFNLPIGKFEGVQEATGRIAGLTYMLESCRTLTASAVDKCAPSVVTAMMKYHMTEMMRELITDTMDIHGGRAVMQGPRNYCASPYMSTPVAITVEGANIMTRTLIIYGQGAIRCHPFVFPEMEAGRREDFDEGMREFDGLLMGHIGYAVNRGVRSFLLALTGSRLAVAPKSGETARYYQHIERYSASLAFFSDLAMGTLGGDLKRKESISARLGDVLSNLYMASAVLKYYESEGCKPDQWVHAEWCLDRCLGTIANAFAELCRNYPIRPAGWLLKLVVQPLGTRHHGPSDSQTQKLADLFMQPNSFADRCLELAYHENEPDDVAGRMLVAGDKLTEISEPYEKFLKACKKGDCSGATFHEKLESAVANNIITEADAKAIDSYDELRYEAILTNAYTKEYLSSSGKRGTVGVGPRMHDIGDDRQAEDEPEMEYLDVV